MKYILEISTMDGTGFGRVVLTHVCHWPCAEPMAHAHCYCGVPVT
jgi:hypothetical protein